MKERRQRTMKEMLDDQLLDLAITERFKAERHPEVSVDGDDPWDRDLFAGEDE